MLHADEPLRRGAENHRRLVAPAVRVAVAQRLVVQQPPVALQGLDDDRVGFLDLEARNQRRTGQEAPIVADRVAHRQPVALADREVFLTVAGGGVHRAGAGLERDVLAQDDRHLPLLQRVRQLQAFERAPGELRQHTLRRHPKAPQARLEQLGGEDQPSHRPAGVGGLDQRVTQLRVDCDRLVRRQRPGRGRPDDQLDRCGAELRSGQPRTLRELGVVDHTKADVDRGRDLLLVFDFGLRERRAAIEAPVHRLHPLVQVPVLHDAAEGAQLLRLVARRHGEVGMIPVAENSEALEIGALQLDLLVRIRAAGGTEGLCVELLARAAVLLLHLQLDRQPVAVPTGYVGRVAAVERARLDDDVLEDLVDGVADVDDAVGIRRPVMQHEARPPARDLAQPRIGAALLPAAHHCRLALRQVRLHREIRLRQIDGVLVVGHLGFISTQTGSAARRRRRGASARPAPRASRSAPRRAVSPRTPLRARGRRGRR